MNFFNRGLADTARGNCGNTYELSYVRVQFKLLSVKKKAKY